MDERTKRFSQYAADAACLTKNDQMQAIDDHHALERGDLLITQGWQPIETASHMEEGLAYRQDAGVFPFRIITDEETGEQKWFTWDGYEDLTNDMPTIVMPFPPAQEQATLNDQHKED